MYEWPTLTKTACEYLILVTTVYVITKVCLWYSAFVKVVRGFTADMITVYFLVYGRF